MVIIYANSRKTCPYTKSLSKFSLAVQNGLLPPFAAFFKFMIALHVLTLAGEICLLLGGLFKIEALLNVWLAVPTGLAFTYSTVYSFVVYKDFAGYGYSAVGFSFSLIGLILYLGKVRLRRCECKISD